MLSKCTAFEQNVLQTWQNDFFKWDPLEYGNTTFLVWRDLDNLWIPYITFYDGYDC
jgi:hypothetical protein